jgi:hypothetical protein
MGSRGAGTDNRHSRISNDPQDQSLWASHAQISCHAVLRLTSRGARVNAKRRGTIEAAVAAALAQTWPADRLAARRVLQRLAEHLGANAAELMARAPARNAARRGGTPRRRS